MYTVWEDSANVVAPQKSEYGDRAERYQDSICIAVILIDCCINFILPTMIAKKTKLYKGERTPIIKVHLSNFSLDVLLSLNV